MSAATDTSERILDAAAELIAMHGYASTTTRAIAEKAGVNEVTLFRRFENKRGILLALGERLAARQAGHAVAEFPAGADPRETLLRLARMEVAGALEGGAFAIRLAFDAQSVPEVAQILGEGMPSNLAGLTTYIAEQQGAGTLRADVPPEVLAEAFFGLTSSYVLYRMMLGIAPMPADIGSDTTIEQLFDVFWSGAVAQKGEQA